MALARSVMWAAAAALVAAVAFAAEADVPSLTKDTFADTIKGDLTLVKFFAPWCGHCKSMKTDYEDAAAALKGKAVLAEVDATIEKDLASEYDIRGFPTIKLFSGGEELSEYKGGRDKDSLIKYIERAMLPSIDELADADAVKGYVSSNKGKTVYISTKLDKLAAAYKKESMSMRDSLPDSVVFGSVTDGSLLKDVAGEDVPDTDSVLVIRDDDSTDVFTGKPEELTKFVMVASVPLLGELSRGNAQIYTELGIPIMLVFQDPKNKNEDMLEEIADVSRANRASGKLAFAWVDGVELKSFVEHLGIADKDPQIAIYEFEGDTKYLFTEEYSKKTISKFVEDFVAGKLEPTKKSAAAPEKNDEPVKIVVADTWEEIVEDESKDVLIEQYAPWCGHCKQLAPVLDEVAKALEGVDTIVVAKMDSTENDAPAAYKAKGFPTMHFFPAGGKEAIEYDGGRKREDFIKFFMEHATHKFDEPKFEDKDDKADDKADEEEEQDEL